MTNPVALETILSRSVEVMRGGKKPCVVLVRSNAAEASGIEVPIPTCA